jgi:hypothetical protein
VRRARSTSSRGTARAWSQARAGPARKQRARPAQRRASHPARDSDCPRPQPRPYTRRGRASPTILRLDVMALHSSVSSPPTNDGSFRFLPLMASDDADALFLSLAYSFFPPSLYKRQQSPLPSSLLELASLSSAPRFTLVSFVAGARGVRRSVPFIAGATYSSSVVEPLLFFTRPNPVDPSPSHART